MVRGGNRFGDTLQRVSKTRETLHASALLGSFEFAVPLPNASTR
jgi:hypothetical protein